MKKFFVMLGVLGSASVGAQDTTTPKKADQKNDRVIVIEESRGKIVSPPPEVFVETGSEALAGEPDDRLKVAYRSWEQKCQEWKRELKQMNGKNLLVASCGKPKRIEETIQAQKLYTYQSAATYKIKVLGK